jgi:hypothetical protein
MRKKIFEKHGVRKIIQFFVSKIFYFVIISPLNFNDIFASNFFDNLKKLNLLYFILPSSTKLGPFFFFSYFFLTLRVFKCHTLKKNFYSNF